MIKGFKWLDHVKLDIKLEWMDVFVDPCFNICEPFKSSTKFVSKRIQKTQTISQKFLNNDIFFFTRTDLSFFLLTIHFIHIDTPLAIAKRLDQERCLNPST